jgi:hypothetical protein
LLSDQYDGKFRRSHDANSNRRAATVGSIEKREGDRAQPVASDRDQTEPNLAEAIRRRFAPLGGVDLELPAGEFVDKPPPSEGPRGASG